MGRAVLELVIVLVDNQPRPSSDNRLVAMGGRVLDVPGGVVVSEAERFLSLITL